LARRKKVQKKRTVLPVSFRTSRISRSTLCRHYNAFYLKYSNSYKIPSKRRFLFSVRTVSGNYAKSKLFGATRDYYVRSARAGSTSFYTGSGSFQEPHFFPGVNRYVFTGGRLCSSFLFSNDLRKRVPVPALLFRLGAEQSYNHLRRTAIRRKKLLRASFRSALWKARHETAYKTPRWFLWTHTPKPKPKPKARKEAIKEAKIKAIKKAINK